MDKPNYFPHRMIQTTIVITMLLCGGVVWHVWHVYEELKIHQTKFSQIQELMGIITYLDEVLTMSARLGATTGDTQWEDRYRRFEQGLDAAIKEIKNLMPDIYSAEAAAQIDAANIKLVEMENQAFALLRAGKREAAFALLTSEQYEQQKKTLYGRIAACCQGLVYADRIVLQGGAPSGHSRCFDSRRCTLALIIYLDSGPSHCSPAYDRAKKC